MYYDNRKDVRNAVLFFIALVAMFLGSLYTAAASSGPIVLGTEMNTNGLVEYLCLGSGCEDRPY